MGANNYPSRLDRRKRTCNMRKCKTNHTLAHVCVVRSGPDGQTHITYTYYVRASNERQTKTYLHIRITYVQATTDKQTHNYIYVLRTYKQRPTNRNIITCTNLNAIHTCTSKQIIRVLIIRAHACTALKRRCLDTCAALHCRCSVSAPMYKTGDKFQRACPWRRV